MYSSKKQLATNRTHMSTIIRQPPSLATTPVAALSRTPISLHVQGHMVWLASNVEGLLWIR